MIEGKTKSGFEYKIPEENLNNYELVEAISEAENNPLVFPRTVNLLLGKEQADKLKDHLRTKNGTVPTDKLSEEIMEIFESQKETKKLISLAGMISLDEDALICDLAETYQIYDYRQLPPSRVAVFAFGLRDDSRIKMKASGQVIPIDTLLLAGISDRLSTLVWFQTADGQKGKNRPTTLTDLLTKKQKESNEDVIVFRSGEDFIKARNELMKAGGE